MCFLQNIRMHTVAHCGRGDVSLGEETARRESSLPVEMIA